jgi:uncharacterized protein YutE (UPF0331/DUF86 family)
MDLVLILKIESIERCLKRIADKYVAEELDDDLDMQDIIVLNIQRACEQSIDIAQRILKIKEYGLAKESAESFLILAENGIIKKEMAEKLKKMVGFRNIAVHDYSNINFDIVKKIVEYGILDIKDFIRVVLKSEL